MTITGDSKEGKIISVVVKGLVFNKGRLLIVQRAPDDEFGAGTWESIGGNLQFGETLEEALQREFLEEVCLEVTVNKLLYSSTFYTSAHRQIVLLVYLCQSEKEDIVLSDEHSQYKWATKAELKNLLPAPILQDFKRHHIFNIQDFVQ
ncbi:NUDIX hydrolase [Lysinibacillus sp. 54212]|uniref:NUDIX hydrolase n=1 Tax=Lysinibacillus sp. 54212 TaxID=3119829 RepID=UPI002FC7F706